MINSLKIEDHLDEIRPWQSDEEITPYMLTHADLINDSERRKLASLNYFRTGSITSGCNLFDLFTFVEDRYIVSYSEKTHDQFCQQLLQIASELEAEGN